MTCVVVTRNGDGDAWLFGSLRDARLHPLVQAWDVVFDGPDAMLRAFGRSGLRSMTRLVPAGPRRVELEQALTRWALVGDREWKDALYAAVVVWDCLVKTAMRLPTDPAVIVSMVKEDRRAMEGRSIRLVAGQESSMSKTKEPKATKEAAAEKKPKAEKVAKEPRPMREKLASTAPEGRIRVSDNAVITLVAESNPKREGTATWERFKNYRTGDTVAQAKAKGLTPGDVLYDWRHGFIHVENPAATENTEESTGDGETSGQEAERDAA